MMQLRARHPRLCWLATITAVFRPAALWRNRCQSTGLASSSPASSQGQASPTFAVSFGPSIRSTPVTGRLFVIISRTDNPAPRLQADQGGVTSTQCRSGVRM